MATVSDRSRPWDILSIFVQLLLIAALVQHLDLLTSAMRRTIDLAIVGFVVHHFLPPRYRLRAFVALCGLTLLLVLGGSPGVIWNARAAVVRALPLAGAGAIVIGLCLLPTGFWRRAALVTLAGALIAALRAGTFGPPSIAMVWPVLAGLFMFRVAIYLYQIAGMKQRPSMAHTLAYFFLLPNIAATFFPVVDFKVFVRSHYDADAIEIYQRGVRWILRGVGQLMLYRIVLQLFAIDVGRVASGTQVIQYILANSFLYVRVSGQFHLLVGLLLLFGFNLPETHRRYFLASSFTDYWRRVNIYWKDFILNIFYYPVYFRLKARGAVLALAAATMWSFFMTWALHQYQTWWVKGALALTVPDALFWFILALLVLVNALWEMKHGRQRRLGAATYSPRGAIGLMLRTAGTFVCVSVLWSLWSAPTLTVWLAMWRFADVHTLAGALAVCACVMVATLVLEIRPLRSRAPAAAAQAPARWTATWRPVLQCAVPVAALYLVATPALQARVDAASLQPWYDAINAGDSITNQIVSGGGYYEHLLDVDQANLQLWETLTRESIPAVYQGADPRTPVRDFRFMQLLPNVHLHAYLTDFSTNRWGMRDRDYALATPADTIRIALVGSSHVMGFGVPDDQIFETIVETRLNATLAAAGGPHVEILNFAMSGLSPLGDIPMVRQRVAPFHPGFVLVVTHPTDAMWVNRDLSHSVREGLPDDSPFLERVLRDARIASTTPEAIATPRLTPFEPAVLAWAYRQTAASIHAIGATPLALFLPLPENLPMTPAKIAAAAQQTAVLRRSGFAVIDFTSIFAHERPADLMLPEPTHHSNVRAHRLVADALYRALLTDPRVGLTQAIAALRRHDHRGAGAPHITG